MAQRRKKTVFQHWRTCTQCGCDILVGPAKCGKAVFPGGVCFWCRKQTGKKQVYHGER